MRDSAFLHLFSLPFPLSCGGVVIWNRFWKFYFIYISLNSSNALNGSFPPISNYYNFLLNNKYMFVKNMAGINMSLSNTDWQFAPIIFIIEGAGVIKGAIINGTIAAGQEKISGNHLGVFFLSIKQKKMAKSILTNQFNAYVMTTWLFNNSPPLTTSHVRV